MVFKYIFNIWQMTNLFLYDDINKNSSNELIDSMNSAVLNGEKEITIHINSGGGSVFDGFAIINSILVHQNEGITINTHVAGIGGSMAGVIAMFGDKITMNDFALLMIHNPTKSNGEPTAEEQKIIDKVKNSLKNIFANRRNMSETEIDKIMSVETWFDSSDAINGGFVDEIIETGVTVENKTESMVFEIANHYQLNDNTISKYNKIKMKDICNKIGIEKTDDVETIQNGIDAFVETKTTELKNEVEILTTGNTEKTEVINDLENKLETFVQERAVQTIENAIADGKIKEDAKDKWIEKAVENHADTIEMLDSISVQPVNVIDLLKTEDEIKDEQTFDDLMNNGGIAEIMKNDWEKYSNLFEAKFGNKPTR